MSKGSFGRPGIMVLSAEHQRVHDGEMFTGGVASAALGAAGYLNIEVLVSAIAEVHVKAVEFYNSLAATFTLVEAPTVTDGTTPVVMYNRRRSSSKGFNAPAFSDPTAISGGTTLETITFSGIVLNNIGPQNNDMEWILKPSTKYIFRLQNNGGGNSVAFMKLHSYEVPV